MSVIEPTYDARDLADALESAVLAFLRVPPVRQALRDLLEVYGFTGQFREVLSNQHDQIVAIAGILTMIYTRLIDHDKRMIEMSQNTLTIMHRQAERMRRQDELPDAIVQLASDALERINSESLAQLAAIDAEAAEARALLMRARADVLQQTAVDSDAD